MDPLTVVTTRLVVTPSVVPSAIVVPSTIVVIKLVVAPAIVVARESVTTSVVGGSGVVLSPGHMKGSVGFTVGDINLIRPSRPV